MSAMTTLLAELEQCYGDVCQRADGGWRRIGVEMAGLTRKPATHKNVEERKKSKIGEAISELLILPESPGKQWAIGECSVWFMEE